MRGLFSSVLFEVISLGVGGMGSRGTEHFLIFIEFFLCKGPLSLRWTQAPTGTTYINNQTPLIRYTRGMWSLSCILRRSPPKVRKPPTSCIPQTLGDGATVKVLPGSGFPLQSAQHTQHTAASHHLVPPNTFRPRGGRRTRPGNDVLHSTHLTFPSCDGTLG